MTRGRQRVDRREMGGGMTGEQSRDMTVEAGIGMTGGPKVAGSRTFCPGFPTQLCHIQKGDKPRP